MSDTQAEQPKRRHRAATKPRRLLSRDLVLFSSGLLLTFNEALFRTGEERPTLLLMFAAMMGLPVVLRADEKRQPKGD